MRRGCSNTLGASAGPPITEIQRKVHVVRFFVGVKVWPPSIDAARPSACVRCGASARVGHRIVIHGHGVRERQQRGPATSEDPPKCVVIVVRRYLCTACRAVMVVLPAQAQPFKHFSGGAIAMALALWCSESASVVRQRVNDWKPGAGARGWRSLSRWARAAGAGVMFAGIHLAVGASVERVAQALCGHAPPQAREAPIHEQAFIGAAHVA